MNYWLVVLPREDMEHCIKAGVFGLKRRNLISNVKADDRIVCCVTKEWKVIALGEAKSDYYVDISEIFLREGPFSDRFDLLATQLPKNTELDFKPLIKEMTFVKKPEHWPVYFKSSIVCISKEDWELISKSVAVQT